MAPNTAIQRVTWVRGGDTTVVTRASSNGQRLGCGSWFDRDLSIRLLFVSRHLIPQQQPSTADAFTTESRCDDRIAMVESPCSHPMSSFVLGGDREVCALTESLPLVLSSTS